MHIKLITSPMPVLSAFESKTEPPLQLRMSPRLDNRCRRRHHQNRDRIRVRDASSEEMPQYEEVDLIRDPGGFANGVKETAKEPTSSEGFLILVAATSLPNSAARAENSAITAAPSSRKE